MVLLGFAAAAVGALLPLGARGSRAGSRGDAAAVAGSGTAPGSPTRTTAPLAQIDPLELLSEVLERSVGAYILLDRSGEIVLANPRAHELGLLRAGLADRHIRSAAARAAAGETVDIDLRYAMPADLIGPRPVTASLHAVVRPLSCGLILVVAADESAAVRVEAVRRDFVANVSHELKTPVGAIALLAEAVHGAATDPEMVRRFSDKLLQEATRLGSLVKELIALSRLQGKDPLDAVAPVPIDRVVDEAAARVATSADRAGITVTTDAPSGLLVMGDEAMLVTALTNLLENAINYSPIGTPVSISRALRDGQVEVAVTDRGIGIAPELQERVFERFFRADPARSRATGGTGLGLAIVKHVAANHGGSTGVWSRPGTGSTFTLRLPELAAPGAAAPEPAGAHLPGGTPQDGVPEPGAPEHDEGEL